MKQIHYIRQLIQHKRKQPKSYKTTTQEYIPTQSENKTTITEYSITHQAFNKTISVYYTNSFSLHYN